MPSSAYQPRPSMTIPNATPSAKTSESLLAQTLVHTALALLLSLLLPSRSLSAMLTGLVLVTSYFISSPGFMDARLGTLAEFLTYHYFPDRSVLPGAEPGLAVRPVGGQSAHDGVVLAALPPPRYPPERGGQLATAVPVIAPENHLDPPEQQSHSAIVLPSERNSFIRILRLLDFIQRNTQRTCYALAISRVGLQAVPNVANLDEFRCIAHGPGGVLEQHLLLRLVHQAE
jgi:hypothetical protein